ncbi:MAG: hypothetical protein IJU56_02230 [Clostridia bacterium]|nr:hypothetical protein [Clostridia bacterium]
MLTYLKLLILSLFGGLFAALPVSYSAHIAYLNHVTSFTEDRDQLGFYFAIISAVFALVVIFKLRRIYGKAFRVALTPKKKIDEPNLKKTCGNTVLGLLISLLPAALMFVPLPNGQLAMDVLLTLLQKDYLLVIASCSIGSGIFLFLAMWYTSRHYDRPQRTAKPLSVLRFSVYQLPSHLLPGISHTATGATALLLTDVEDLVIEREVLLYLAPSLLIVNVARIVRFILSGLVLQPVLIAIAAVGSLLGSILTLHLISKFNIRKNYLFFAIYSILFGALIVVTSFLV